MIDPITVSVVERRLDAITKEMGLALLRTTRSPIFNQARDFVTGLYDRRGRMLAQTEYIPILAFALPSTLVEIIKFFGDEVYPGDVFIANDVYYGGNQSQDIAVFRPVFYGSELSHWAATKGHHADVGGSGIGGYNPKAKDIWQETLRITPIKIYERGKLRRDVWNQILANVRVPEIVGGDLSAQVGSCVVGERRIIELLDHYGAEELQSNIEFLMDSTEKRMREEIKTIPDGRYYGTATNDDDGADPDKMYTTRVAITVVNGEITFDFTGTDPQAPTYINAVYATTASATMLTFLMCVDPNIPHNEGMLRPIKIIVPEGTVLNARFPAPTGHGNFTTSDTIPDAIFKALAPVVPDKISAGWQRWCGGPISGIDPRKNKLYVDTTFLSGKGGGGATQGVDGWSHIGLISCAGGLRTQDYEMHEIQDPHFLIEHEYWTDSAGAGKWRGGLGVHTIFRVHAENPAIAMHGDGMKEENAAFGLFSGRKGKNNACYFRFPDGRVVVSQSKANYELEPGVEIECFAGGGGGFGNPYDRDPHRVREDVRNGFVSIEAARQEYGVVVNADTMEIDWEWTDRTRQIPGELQ